MIVTRIDREISNTRRNKKIAKNLQFPLTPSNKTKEFDIMNHDKPQNMIKRLKNQ